MNCPRCETTSLSERERDGVVVDACPACRGIWLDRGELEKLIARATRELDELHDRGAARPHDGRYERDDGDDYRRHAKRKRSWVESLGDIFD